MNIDTSSTGRLILLVGTVFGLAALMGGALSLMLLAPLPWKLWGGTVVLILAASVLVQRALQTITNTSAVGWMPYVVATYLVLVPIIVFASGMVQLVAGIVFVSITGAAMFYWLVASFVAETKKLFKGSSSPHF